MKLFSFSRSALLLIVTMTLSVMVFSGCTDEDISNVSFHQTYQNFIDHQLDDAMIQKIMPVITSNYLNKVGNITLNVTHPDAHIDVKVASDVSYGYPKDVAPEEILDKTVYDGKMNLNIQAKSTLADMPISGSADVAGTINFSLADLVASVKLSDAKVKLLPNATIPGFDAQKAQIDSFISMFAEKWYKLDLKKVLPYDQLKAQMSANPFSIFEMQTAIAGLPSQMKEYLSKNTLFVQTGEKTEYKGKPAYVVTMDKEVLKGLLTMTVDTVLTSDTSEVVQAKKDIKEGITNAINELTTSDTDWITMYLIVTGKKTTQLYLSGTQNTKAGPTVTFSFVGGATQSKGSLNIVDEKQNIIADVTLEGNQKGGTATLALQQNKQQMATAKVNIALTDLSDDKITTNASINATLTKALLAQAMLPSSVQSDVNISLNIDGTAKVIDAFTPKKQEGAVNIMDMMGGILPGMVGPANMDSGYPGEAVNPNDINAMISSGNTNE